MEGAEARGGGRDGRSEVDGGKRGRAGVLLRGSVVKRIDPNHYDMSRLRSVASTMAGSSPESETPSVAQFGLTIQVFYIIRFLDFLSLDRYVQVMITNISLNRN